MTAKTSKSLFSQHYLTRRLPDHAKWREDAGEALAAARDLYEAKKSVLPNYNEAQTEEEFIQPLLNGVLGFAGAYTVQTTVHQQGQLQRPDYALFANAAGKTEADQYLQNESAFYARAVAVADAKHWQRPLSERAHYDNRNPSHQIVSYLVATGADWGILSNGRIWRLYSRQVSGPATEFYEVDLVDILENRPQDFRRFWLFFRRQAFIPDAQGNNFLDRVRAGSATYARVVGDQLKDRVFDEIFPLLAGGFMAGAMHEGEDVSSGEARSLIYEATLSLLYKLLFLLYGEARGLLPVTNKGYHRHSLTRIAQEVAQRLDNQEPLGERATWLYDRLLALFELIDEGDKGIGLPRYNGGLFHFDFRDPEARQKQRENWFLTRHKVSDRRLARALDLLGRIDGEGVDYGYIGVRHLGAIYEGLLEYRLIVDDAMTGEVHLENDRGERKATGSYYTPDYIVKYIVSHTLEPILEERAARFAALMEEIVPKRTRLARLEDKLTGSQAGDLSPSVESRYRNEQHVLQQDLQRLKPEAREALLDIKVCDPAMGSGHFLVEVVDFLTTHLITILNEHPEHNPVLSWLSSIREEILTNMEVQGIAVDPERLDDTQLLQRVLMKRCIYGVDLNRMAVELAKVSLWLHTFTIGAPLSFLDHHLRWGNSLVGGMAREAEEKLSPDAAQGQIALSFMSGPFAGLLRAAEIMRGISGLADATLEEVERSEELFREFDHQAKPYKRLLDVYAMRPFLDKEARQTANDFLLYEGQKAVQLARAGPEATEEDADRQVLESARHYYQSHRFFHWDLEFPEVFINLERADWKRNPGFDAVVGNPPYVRQEGLRESKPYFKEEYPEVYAGTADLFVYFFGRALQLLKEGGRTSYISSNSWLRANYATALRAFLRQEATIESLIDLGDNRVFEDAPDLYPAIHVVQWEKPDTGYKASAAVFSRGEGISDFAAQLAEKRFAVSIHNQRDEGWQLETRDVRNLFVKLKESAVTSLDEVVDGELYRGLITGLNQAFVIDDSLRKQLIETDPSSEGVLKPYLRGQDLRPWLQEPAGQWLIAFPSGWTKEKLGDLAEEKAWSLFSEAYPAIAVHLKQYERRARKRYDQGEYWWELRACDYYDAFEKTKIVWPDIAKFPRFSWDDHGFYLGNTAYFVVTNKGWVASYLSSRCVWFLISRTSTALGERTGMQRYRLFDQYIRPLSVPHIPAREKEHLSSLRISLTKTSSTRYQLQENARHRIRADLANGKKKLGNKLTHWWELDSGTFRTEIKRRFKKDIPLEERDEWETWLAMRRTKHEQYTAEIVRLETELNDRVYALFDLTPEEIRIVEESTKYEYGEV